MPYGDAQVIRAAQAFKAQEALQQMAHNRCDYGKKANKLISLLEKQANGRVICRSVFFQTRPNSSIFSMSEMTATTTIFRQRRNPDGMLFRTKPYRSIIDCNE